MSLVRILAGGFEGEFLLLLGLFKKSWGAKRGFQTFRNTSTP
jgi:hypothetical protein